MNTSAKGDRFALDLKHLAEEYDLDVVKVVRSGHMGRRGGVPADLVISGIRVEAKRYCRGIGSTAIEEILTGDQGVGVVAHRCDGGIPLVTMRAEDWMQLLKDKEGK